jgi:hypothetical protein
MISLPPASVRRPAPHIPERDRIRGAWLRSHRAVPALFATIVLALGPLGATSASACSKGLIKPPCGSTCKSPTHGRGLDLVHEVTPKFPCGSTCKSTCGSTCKSTCGSTCKSTTHGRGLDLVRKVTPKVKKSVRECGGSSDQGKDTTCFTVTVPPSFTG